MRAWITLFSCIQLGRVALSVDRLIVLEAIHNLYSSTFASVVLSLELVFALCSPSPVFYIIFGLK